MKIKYLYLINEANRVCILYLGLLPHKDWLEVTVTETEYD